MSVSYANYFIFKVITMCTRLKSPICFIYYPISSTHKTTNDHYTCDGDAEADRNIYDMS